MMEHRVDSVTGRNSSSECDDMAWKAGGGADAVA